MSPRHLLPLLLAAAALVGCAQEPPAFPNSPPPAVGRYSPEGAKTKEPPPPAHGVATFAMSREARVRSIVVTGAGAGAFLLVVLIVVGIRLREAMIPAGIAAALVAPLSALLISARYFPSLLVAAGARTFDFAQLALDMWNANQPLLYGLYGSAVLLVILLIVAFRRSEVAGSVSLTILPLLTMAAAAIAFLCFFEMNGLIVAAVDPAPSHPLSMSIATISQTIARRLIGTLVMSFVAGALALVTMAWSFARRGRMRGAVAIVLVALAFVAGAALMQRTWCYVLEAAARTGRLSGAIGSIH